ncbi:hypothetical protein LPJ57_003586 [Coemansia sp. RSA 486]|nr:hypothetical protein LPJ57_003586 [Coemansia sp. RSA 486]
MWFQSSSRSAYWNPHIEQNFGTWSSDGFVWAVALSVPAIAMRAVLGFTTFAVFALLFAKVSGVPGPMLLTLVLSSLGALTATAVCCVGMADVGRVLDTRANEFKWMAAERVWLATDALYSG